MNLSTIRFEELNTIAYLTLNRPPKNALDALFFDEFAWLADGVFPNLRVTGMIIHGSDRHFSSGTEISDLKAMTGSEQVSSGEESFARNVACFERLTSLSFPVVAAIRGCCLGSGMELALACHYRIASRQAVIGLPETQFGLMPGCGGTIRLRELIGHGKAAELILTGKSLLAEEARDLGIVDAIADKNQVIETAQRLIHRIREITPYADIAG